MNARPYLSAGDVLSFLDSRVKKGQPGDNQKRRQYRLAASVLAGIQDPENLRPLTGSWRPGEGRELLKDELVPATGRRLEGRLMLDLESRRGALKELGTRRSMAEALQANPHERTGPVQLQFERFLQGGVKPINEQSPEDLSASLQVLVWLDGVLDDLPNIEEVRMQMGRQSLLAPFEAIAGDAIFRGRSGEMADLRKYVGVLPPESFLARLSKLFRWTRPEMMPALSVSGPGGVGKSALIARFMLEHSRLPEEGRIPFAYLDFDRTSLSVSEPATLLMEMLRQLDLQFPQGAKFRPLIDFLDKQAGNPEEAMWASRVNTASAIRSVMADMLGTLESLLGPRPYVLVLDTFEEVQYRGEATAFPFWDCLVEMQARRPFLRVVVCGRAPVTTLQLADKPPLELKIGDLDDQAAVAFLRTQGIHDEKLASGLVKQVGGVPLSLKLAASVIQREGRDRSGVRDFSGRSRFWFSATDEVIQGQLYDRILGHIHNEQVRRLAYPGLILRRIRADVILHVLNEPCGLGITSMEEAETVFEELRKETPLVTSDSADGSLVHRADVRRMTLKFLIQRAPAQVEQIRRAAVAWYSAQTGDWRAKAEELYHRLQLGETISAQDVEHPEVRTSLQASLVELPISAQTYLATLGFKVSPEVLSQATQAQVEAYTASQVEELLPYGPTSVSQARGIAEGAIPQDHSSPLYRSAARVAMQELRFSDALEWIEKGTTLALKEGDTGAVLDLTVERTWTLRHLNNTVELEQATEILGQYAEMRNRNEPLLLNRVLRWELEQGRETGTNSKLLLREIGDRFRNLRPIELWDLFPAFQKVGWSLGTSVSDFTSLLRAKLAAEDGPFPQIQFSGLSLVDSLFENLMSQVTQNETAPAAVDLAGTFMALCNGWPYKCLSVQPPYGSSKYDRSYSAEAR